MCWRVSTRARYALRRPSSQLLAASFFSQLLPTPRSKRVFTSSTMALTRSDAPLVWVDCEMTGLDPSTDSILSLACFVTDAKLKKLEPNGFEAIIHHDPVRLDQMDAWCTRTHGESGLTAACIDSTTTAEQAVHGLLTYVKQLVPEKGTALLAGNSIHADKSFLVKPPYDQVINHLHYRLFDVSAIKEAMRRWAPVSVLEKVPVKQYKHTARDDIEESIEEARYYRSLFEQM